MGEVVGYDSSGLEQVVKFLSGGVKAGVFLEGPGGEFCEGAGAEGVAFLFFAVLDVGAGGFEGVADGGEGGVGEGED